jgi:hypothetical protein
MRMKSLIAAASLGVGLTGTSLVAAEAAAATPTPVAAPTSPGHLPPNHPGGKPSNPGSSSNPGQPPAAAPPGKAIPKTPNYTG